MLTFVLCRRLKVCLYLKLSFVFEVVKGRNSVTSDSQPFYTYGSNFQRLLASLLGEAAKLDHLRSCDSPVLNSIHYNVVLGSPSQLLSMISQVTVRSHASSLQVTSLDCCYRIMGLSRFNSPEISHQLRFHRHWWIPYFVIETSFLMERILNDKSRNDII